MVVQGASHLLRPQGEMFGGFLCVERVFLGDLNDLPDLEPPLETRLTLGPEGAKLDVRKLLRANPLLDGSRPDLALGTSLFTGDLLDLLGGFIAATLFVIAVHFFFDHAALTSLPKFFAVFSIIGFVALVTIAWEILEFFSDRYLGTSVQLTIADTLKDMVVGLLGATPAALSWPRPSNWEHDDHEGK